MTSFETVFDVFLHKIIDRNFIEIPEEVAIDDLKHLLKSAIFNFEYPRISLATEDSLDAFAEDLTNDEIQLLASIMVKDWFSRNSKNIDLYTMDMTTSEFKTFSKGSQLSSLQKMGESLESEINDLKRIYHMRDGSYSRLAGV